MLDCQEEVLEAVNEFFVDWFIVPTLGILTKFGVENLKATGERAAKGPARVVHLAYKARADPPGYSDGCWVHLGQVGTARCAPTLLESVEVRSDAQCVI